MAIDDRKQRVLMTIVRLYSAEGEPVGSQLLCRHLGLAVSSATLRNEMAALTRLGLLEQPHTSAGRVPTAAGYRYYVDWLMNASPALAAADKIKIDNIFAQLDYDPEKLVQGAAKALSDWMRCAVVATTPHTGDMRVVHFALLQVGRHAAALLGVTSGGGVRTRVVKTDFELEEADLKRVEELLNTTLRFVAEDDITLQELYQKATLPGMDAKKALPFLSAALVLIAEANTPSVYLEGNKYFLRWPELRANLQALMELFGEDARLQTLLTAPAGRTAILFGEDLPEPIPGFCMLSRRYLAGSGLTGNIAVAGPARMPFGEALPRLEYFSTMLGQSITGVGA